MLEKLTELMIKLMKEKNVHLSYMEGVLDMYNETVKILKEEDNGTN